MWYVIDDVLEVVVEVFDTKAEALEFAEVDDNFVVTNDAEVVDSLNAYDYEPSAEDYNEWCNASCGLC